MRKHLGFYTPFIREEKCTNCGICKEVCPGINPGMRSSRKELDATFHDSLLGGYTNIYVGHANNPKIRQSASSGGVATALLCYMLKEGLIDGATVVTMGKNSLRAHAMFATSEREICEAAGSKYTPITMDEVLRKVVEEKRRFAFVGLPCHIEALRKSEKIFKELKDLVKLRIGLYCNNTPSVLATKYVLWNYNIPIDEVSKIRYRGNGWPGYLFVNVEGGKTVKIPFTVYWESGFGQYFCKKRCIVCCDHSAELADISLADPWSLKSRYVKKNGESIVVTRSVIGDKILKNAFQAGFVSINRIDLCDAIQFSTLLKKRNKSSRSVKALLGLKTASDQFEYALPLDFSATKYILAFRVQSFLAQYEKLWPLLRISRLIAIMRTRKIH
jgi:coenzyme F420 hydrogenase subunit beta